MPAPVIARYEAIQAQAMIRLSSDLHCLCLDCFTAFAMTVRETAMTGRYNA
ncbi:MAG: hypothetical protein LBJ47_04710 [Tannerella sp.]|nr:hypothetical protein [Tannerella sp.]